MVAGGSPMFAQLEGNAMFVFIPNLAIPRSRT